MVVIVPYFMTKSFLIILNTSILLFSSQQALLVVADDFNTSKAILNCYEDNKLVFSDIKVNIGRSGLAWGLGVEDIQHSPHEPIKYEGDGKAPIGVFKLTNIFGYTNTSQYSLPYLYTSKELICVDDSKSNFYNQIIQAHGDEKSFEYMKREDSQYKLGVVVEHNKNAVSARGSCIFLHVQKKKGASTAGCTSMKYDDLEKIVNWLDKKKNPLLIQVPKKYLKEAKELIKKF